MEDMYSTIVPVFLSSNLRKINAHWHVFHDCCISKWTEITSSGLETSEIVLLIKNERKEEIILVTLSWWMIPIESNVHALLEHKLDGLNYSASNVINSH